mmetsp:Transcript_10992/g.24221  ORF Transcript_10992/g.24221 Transcript_10992/m.24221 type:complete len:247 (+) Transcript_10992:293-1033(+)
MQLVDIFSEVHVEPPKAAILWVKDAGVNTGSRERRFRVLERLHTAALNGASLEEINTLLDHVQFDQASVPAFRVFNCVELFSVKPVYVADIPQPIFERGDVIFVLDRRPHSPAVVVPADNDMRNLQNADSILESRHQIKICSNNHVGYVANGEDTASILPHEYIRRDAGIRTSYPEVFRCVPASKLVEIILIFPEIFLHPLLVLFENVLDVLVGVASTGQRQCTQRGSPRSGKAGRRVEIRVRQRE